MSIEENRELIRRLVYDDLNTGDPAVTPEIFAEEFYDPTNPPGMQHGIEGHRAVVALFHSAFSDLHWEIEDMVAGEEKVAVELTMYGRHTGDFFGIPPTHREVKISGFHFLHIENGKVIKHTGVNDDLGFMRQLGVIPTPEEQPA